MSRRGRAAGFTLVELMVGVVLVGVLATLGVSLLRNKPRAIDVAAQLSGRIAEASRKAIAGGAVRSNVLEALGARIRANQARTRVILTVGTGGGTITVWRLQEAPMPANTASWVQLSSATLDRSVTISGYQASATVSGGAAAPAIALTAGQTVPILCYPDGSCDGRVIYLSSSGGRRRARVVVMPLGGSPLTFDSW